MAKPKQIKKINFDIFPEVADLEFIIDTNGIRHTIKQHGSEYTEIKRGQLPINLDDFNHVKSILSSPDEIQYAGKNKEKKDVFIYKKQIGYYYFVATVIRYSKKGDKAIFTTFYKRKLNLK
jgi:phage-Barnase-EndoU-ColicinE5/D-RelE like nuclease3